ncbi:MAG: KamA family radical SAM protein [bacterium]
MTITSKGKRINGNGILESLKGITPQKQDQNHSIPPARLFQTTSIKEKNLENWDSWQWQIKNRITTLEELEKWVQLTQQEKKAIHYSAGRLKMAITPHFVSLMDKVDPGCPIRRQAIPSLAEFRLGSNDLSDPCGEEKDTVVPGIVHRYPDRVLLIITDACAMYCRHCTRRRIVGGREETLTVSQIEQAIQYIRKNDRIRDVLISGGDPLIMSNARLEEVLSSLKSIPHIQMIRIGTRLPVSCPQRIDQKLCNMLKKYHPLYLSIHFNHPREISQDTMNACDMLASSGIPLGSQTVLLRGINDKISTMKELVHKLLHIRVKPYYLYQCDLAFGTEHFRTTVHTGVNIIESLQGFTTGYAVPTFVIDAPGGGGKIPVNPNYVITENEKGVILKNFQGKVYVYPDKNNCVSLETAPAFSRENK